MNFTFSHKHIKNMSHRRLIGNWQNCTTKAARKVTTSLGRIGGKALGWDLCPQKGAKKKENHIGRHSPWAVSRSNHRLKIPVQESVHRRQAHLATQKTAETVRKAGKAQTPLVHRSQHAFAISSEQRWIPPHRALESELCEPFHSLHAMAWHWLQGSQFLAKDSIQGHSDGPGTWGVFQIEQHFPLLELTQTVSQKQPLQFLQPQRHDP